MCAKVGRKKKNGPVIKNWGWGRYVTAMCYVVLGRRRKIKENEPKMARWVEFYKRIVIFMDTQMYSNVRPHCILYATLYHMYSTTYSKFNLIHWLKKTRYMIGLSSHTPLTMLCCSLVRLMKDKRLIRALCGYTLKGLNVGCVTIVLLSILRYTCNHCKHLVKCVYV